MLIRTAFTDSTNAVKLASLLGGAMQADTCPPKNRPLCSPPSYSGYAFCNLVINTPCDQYNARLTFSLSTGLFLFLPQKQSRLNAPIPKWHGPMVKRHWSYH